MLPVLKVKLFFCWFFWLVFFWSRTLHKSRGVPVPETQLPSQRPISRVQQQLADPSAWNRGKLYAMYSR